MNILVCLKAVPDPSAAIEISDDHSSLRILSSAPYVMSTLDEQALEEALTIKDRYLDAAVHALTIGLQERSLHVLRRALGMGAEKAILGNTRTPSLIDHPLVAASAIASWARTHTYSLYILGASSDDLMQGQVGPMLAELMGLPCASCVVAIDATGDETIVVERELQSGIRCRLEMDLPAVVTILSSRQTPRYPSLSNMLRAKKKLPECYTFDPDLSPESFKYKVSYHTPPKGRNALVLRGDIGNQADQLIDILRSKGLI